MNSSIINNSISPLCLNSTYRNHLHYKQCHISMFLQFIFNTYIKIVTLPRYLSFFQTKDKNIPHPLDLHYKPHHFQNINIKSIIFRSEDTILEITQYSKQYCMYTEMVLGLCSLGGQRTIYPKLMIFRLVFGSHCSSTHKSVEL